MHKAVSSHTHNPTPMPPVRNAQAPPSPAIIPSPPTQLCQSATSTPACTSVSSSTPSSTLTLTSNPTPHFYFHNLCLSHPSSCTPGSSPHLICSPTIKSTQFLLMSRVVDWYEVHIERRREGAERRKMTVIYEKREESKIFNSQIHKWTLQTAERSSAPQHAWTWTTLSQTLLILRWCCERQQNGWASSTGRRSYLTASIQNIILYYIILALAFLSLSLSLSIYKLACLCLIMYRFVTRMTEVSEEIKQTGTYFQTYDELSYACKVAWRNAARYSSSSS